MLLSIGRRVTIAVSAAVTSPHLDLHAQSRSADSWRQWGGPNRNFIVNATGLADKWPETGPPVLWRRPLGTGHSAILVDEGRLSRCIAPATAAPSRARGKPKKPSSRWMPPTGKTLWEHKYPSRREDFSFGAGPHSTPLIVGDRLFTIGTNKQLFAFDKRSGKVLWSHDFIKEFNSPELLIRPVVKTGYGCSPIAYRDTIICSVGGPGQSVMAFRQSDGARGVEERRLPDVGSAADPDHHRRPRRSSWSSAAAPSTAWIPATGRILWSHRHDPGNDLNCGTPLFGPDNILFVSSAYRAGSRAIKLSAGGAATRTPTSCGSPTACASCSSTRSASANIVYGTTGDFGPAFLTALDIKTGQAAWQHRGFGRASLVHADGKAIIMDEDGDLALAKLAPEGVTILSEAKKVFDTMSWTVPTLVGKTLYARDREKIVALNLGAQ